MQTQRGYDDYKNTVDTFRKIYQQEGLKALYRGVVPSMFGLIHVGIQFPTYEYLLAKQAQLRHEEVKDLTAGQVFVASALSKVIASVIAYPHEVLRSRLQDANHAIAANDKPTEFKKYSGVTDAIRTIWKDEGPRAFYRGMGANLLRTVPAAVITLSSYEAFRKALMKIGDA
jgi:solute carrier family 25 folate transporter 32